MSGNAGDYFSAEEEGAHGAWEHARAQGWDGDCW